LPIATKTPRQELIGFVFSASLRLEIRVLCLGFPAIGGRLALFFQLDSYQILRLRSGRPGFARPIGSVLSTSLRLEIRALCLGFPGEARHIGFVFSNSINR
jgi:hypothetical protein